MTWLSAPILTAMLATWAAPASAEGGCPAGYEPWRVPIQSLNDCLPIPGYADAPEAARAPPPLAPQWFSTSSAVAFGNRKPGAAFATDFVYFKFSFSDEADVRKLAVEKCVEQGLSNCALAGSITNGFIVVYSDREGRIAAHGGADRQQVIDEIHARCAADNRVCKVRKVIDSLPIRM